MRLSRDTVVQWLPAMALVVGGACTVAGEPAQQGHPGFTDGAFHWKASEPLLEPMSRTADRCVAIKDPTIVRYKDRWHMFCTVRFESGRVDVEYLSFTDWDHTEDAGREVLHLHEPYYGAPQVFYFTPHGKWYLVYQLADENRKPPWGPYYSTTTDIGDPKSWSKPQPLFRNPPEGQKWLDFWVICDQAKAHLFFTSLDGRMWRSETKRTAFPDGWTKPAVILKADIFEASQTYKLKGMNTYLTIVEAQGNRRRYYKAYVADRLEGPWRGLADSREKPFAAFGNVEQENLWTHNISHGELLRSGYDEALEVDPAHLRLVFQGATDKQYRGNRYGMIPWRLGILVTSRQH